MIELKVAQIYKIFPVGLCGFAEIFADFLGAGNLLSAVSFAPLRFAKGCRCNQGYKDERKNLQKVNVESNFKIRNTIEGIIKKIN